METSDFSRRTRRYHVRALVFEFSSQSSVLLYLGYAIDRHQYHSFKIISNLSNEKQINTHSNITKVLALRARTHNTGTAMENSMRVKTNA